MKNNELLYYCQTLLDELIDLNQREIPLLIDDWLSYNNPLSNTAIEYIINKADKLSHECIDNLISVLNRHEQTKYTLLLIKKLNECDKKEDFIL